MKSLAGVRILVVDDEPDLREVLCDEFALAGANVSTAENGRKALEMLEQMSFDAVVSDIRMPGGNGVELLENIRKKNPAKPTVILMTGYADLSLEEALHKGADAMFNKPCDLDDVVVAIERSLKLVPEKFVPRDQRFQFKATVVLKDTANGQSFHKFALNIGRGGFFILFDQNAPKTGREFDFELIINQPLSTKMQGRCVCRWSRTQSLSGEPIGAGFEFVSLTEASQIALMQLNSEFTQAAFIPRE